MRYAIVVALVWVLIIAFLMKVTKMGASPDAQLLSVAVVFAGALVRRE